MFAGSSAGMGTRGGVRAGNGTGLTTLQVANASGGLGVGMNTGIAMPDGGRYDERESTDAVVSCSDAESDSGDDEDIGSAGDRRGVKRERAEMEVGGSAGSVGLAPSGYGASAGGGVAGAKPGKKTRGRVKIKMEFIDNKLRRYTTFSKRKTGIMKKAYELSTLTGTQVLLLVASETGHVYTFATRKLQPMITSETGKALIQTCLNSPDSPAPRSTSDPSSEQRMSATGFEETELSYQVAEGGEDGKAGFSLASLQAVPPGSTSTPPSSSSSSSSPPPPPLPSSSSSATTSSSSAALSWSGGANGTLLKSTSAAAQAHTQTHGSANANANVMAAVGTTSAGVVLPQGFTIMSGAALSQQLQLQVQASGQQGGAIISSSSDSTPTSDINHTTVSSNASHPSTIITSSSSSVAGGHMMYPSPHAVMYATPTQALTAEGGGGLTVLNSFPLPSHSQAQDTGGVPQMFFTSPQGTVQIPVPLHSMLIGQQQPGGGGSGNLTELRVVSLDSAKAD